MLEFYVIIILIIVFMYLIYSFISVPLFLINVTIIILVAIAISKDIKERNKQAYYLGAAFLTALVFIFRNIGIFSKFSRLMNQFYILEYTYAIILIFLFAQLLQFLNNYLPELIDGIKKKLKEKK